MTKHIEKFLEFNGKRLSVLSADGAWWVALRPICDALNVDYHAQYKRLQGDRILSRVLSKQTTHDASNRLQEMVCIKEKFAYGWLFSIQSESAELAEYKMQCYEVLFDHFHGALSGRLTALGERSETELEIIALQEQLDAKLLESEEYQKIQELKKKHKAIAKTLKDLDAELMKGQLTMDLR